MSLRVSVLVSGIVDPKWPVSALGLEAVGGSESRTESANANAILSRRLSPFDEAAVECALQLRDADPAVELSFVVACEAPCDALLRAVAAFRPRHLRGLALPRDLLWDAQATAFQLDRLLAEAPEPADLVLIGREFGDCDEGTLPPCLAEALGCPYLGLVQEVRAQEDVRQFVRERDGMRELIGCAALVVASVTNARSNRLRHPLMKNVMAARRERLAISTVDSAGTTGFRRLYSLTEAAPKPRGAEPCRMLTGTPWEQAEQVIDWIRRVGLGDQRT